MEKLTDLVNEAIRLQVIVAEKEAAYDAIAKIYFHSDTHYDRRTKVYKTYEKARKESSNARHDYNVVIHAIGLRCVSNTQNFRANVAKHTSKKVSKK